uniref:Uncharacterized protein n=1 Tax=Ignisphaera aggregans TaxID=334771 RepID=A0A7J3YVK9_9CREN
MGVEIHPLTKNWALNWIKGSIVSYLRGDTPINIIKGRIKRAVESYGVKPEEIGVIINLLQIDPLLTIPRELREEKARPLLGFIEELKRGEESG